MVSRVNPKNDFYGWLKNDENWNDFKLEPQGWISFKEEAAVEFPDAQLEDPWSKEGSRKSSHMQVRSATGQSRPARHANDARSSGSDAVLVETIGSRASSKPRGLGKLTVVTMSDIDEDDLWKSKAACAEYEKLSRALGEQEWKSKTFPKAFSVCLRHQGFGTGGNFLVEPEFAASACRAVRRMQEADSIPVQMSARYSVVSDKYLELVQRNCRGRVEIVASTQMFATDQQGG